MYIPDSLKVNKFVAVDIPSPKSFFTRFGETAIPEKNYSGDDVVPEPMRKVDSLADYEAYAEMMANEESSKSN